MRVLVLSPGQLHDQLRRLPAIAAIGQQLEANVQVACAPAVRAVWDLLPSLEKVIPFDFGSNPTLADWANLLGNVREPDFQVCLNFAEGQQVNLMLSMSHIPTRIAERGFACTQTVAPGAGWPAQALAAYLTPLGCDLNADAFRLALPASELDEIRASQPSGDGPLLLLAPNGQDDDWPTASWEQLPSTIRNRLGELRCLMIPPSHPLRQRAAAIACADVVLTSCPISQGLAAYCGTPLVALGAQADDLPQRENIRSLGHAAQLNELDEASVLSALGF
ncbi:MAG: glycosyltransferase family 9 protein [Synechococcus sp.]